MIRPHEALRRYPGFLMFWIGQRTSSRFASALEPLGLHPRHFGALNVIHASEGLSQQDLGRTMGIDPSTMVFLLDELEERGLVERRRHPKDRRAYALHVTDKGEDTLKRGRRVAGRMQEDLFGHLSQQDRDDLVRILGAVARHLDEEAERP